MMMLDVLFMTMWLLMMKNFPRVSMDMSEGSQIAVSVQSQRNFVLQLSSTS
jgi:hypothetical protein